MKNYKEVEMLAKNAPTGSYAAGCPAVNNAKYGNGKYDDICYRCEVAH